MRSHLSPLDAVFLELEQADEAAHMHIGWAMIFDPPPGGARPSLERLRSQVRERISERSILRRRLSSPRIDSLSLPIWLPDPDFDIGQLLRHATLPQPGGEAELTDWVGEYFAQRLDRSRPLWETTLLEGLADGRWALVSKIHHCLIDGLSGAKVAAALLDAEPEPDEGTTTLSGLVNSLGEDSQRTVLARLRGVVGEAISGGVDAALHPQRVLSIVSESREMAERLARQELAPAPATSLNGRVGTGRRLAALDVPLEDVRQIKRELGGTFNDVLLAATAGGLRRLFEHRGEDVDRVRAMVPVDMRLASESLTGGRGHPSLFVDLALSEPDPLARYRTISAAARGRKSADLLTGSGAGSAVPAPLVQTAIARLSFTPGLFNVTVTNVPAFPATLYSLGAPLRHAVPLIPIFSGQAVGVAVVSYDGRLYFGLNADREAVPDLELMRDGIAETLAGLAEATAGRPRSPRPTSPV
jgi:diacylglycerol O-acyltransferase / wax synthase